MRLLAGVLAAEMVLAQSGSQEPPALEAKIKAWAAEYDERLQDFLCIQQMSRYKGSAGASPNWELLERQELEVSYHDKKVGYHRISVDGKTDKLEKRVKKGYLIPGGEFVALNRVFDPKAAADLTFDHREAGNDRTGCVFRYQVPVARTNIGMSVNGEQVPLGYRGFIDSDCETGEVRRVRVATDPGFAHLGRDGKRVIPVGEQLDIRYEPVEISGNHYLLPSHAVLTGLFNTALTRADIDFTNYRKYSSSSNVSFDDVR